MQCIKWPSPRVDSCALLISGGDSRTRSAPPVSPRVVAQPPTTGFLREISKLSGFHIRRAARCSYSVLAADQDSTESLLRTDRSDLTKSRSAYIIDERQPADGDEGPLSRDPLSVPDFEALSPRTTLVYVDSDDSTKLTRDDTTTSDYASADAVDAAAGFSNPHYLGPDVRRLAAARTPDSGAGDMELRELRPRAAPAPALHLLLVGGREPPHVALLQSPLSMWSYRLL